MLTDDQLNKWQKLANEATGGDWFMTLIASMMTGVPPHVAVHSMEGSFELSIYSGGRQEDAEFITAARTAVPALLDEVKRLRVERIHADALANDMAVIQDAIATGFWNTEDIWVYLKTDEGDELARDVQLLWLELMWADFVRVSAHEHWDGFTFTKPALPEPRKFFEGIDTDSLYG